MLQLAPRPEPAVDSAKYTAADVRIVSLVFPFHSCFAFLGFTGVKFYKNSMMKIVV